MSCFALGGGSRSPRESCSKPGDGFLSWNCRDQTGFQFGFSSIRFSFPSFLDLGVCIKASDQPLEQMRAIGRC